MVKFTLQLILTGYDLLTFYVSGSSIKLYSCVDAPDVLHYF
jgi:hypothetical protein